MVLREVVKQIDLDFVFANSPNFDSRRESIYVPICQRTHPCTWDGQMEGFCQFVRGSVAFSTIPLSYGLQADRQSALCARLAY